MNQSSDPTCPAAVLIYVLLVFGIMGSVLALVLSVFSANNAFANRTFAGTRLKLENQSVLGQIFTLYQTDPRHPKLVQFNTPRRSVSYSAYVAQREGYVYPNKTDVVTVDGRDYPDQVLIPGSLIVKNLAASTGPLYAIGRVVSVDTGFIQSSTFAEIAVNAQTSLPFLIPDLTGGEQRYVRRYELTLFSEKDALYEVVPDSPKHMIGNALSVSVSSKNNAIISSNQTVVSANASLKLRPDATILSSAENFQGGSSGTAFVSSKSQPGISSAFVDLFDVWSDKNWIFAPGPLPTPTAGAFTIPTGNKQMEFAINASAYAITGDFDLRAVVEQTSASPTQDAGVYVYDQSQGFGSAYKIGVASKTAYQNTGGFCTSSTQSGYMFYQGASEPTNFSDGSSVCSMYTTPYLPFAPTGTPTATYTLRIERKNGQLNGFYCQGGEEACDRKDSFLVINPQPISFVSTTPARIGLYTRISDTLKVRSIRLARISPATDLTYDKPLTFERQVKIKQVDILGYVPSGANLVVTTIPNLCAPAGNCGNLTRIIPASSVAATSSLALSIRFRSATGDLSEIPFIHGIRVYYE